MKIKNWKKFQHYRNRKPPWIKLYCELLNDPEWHDLKPEDAKILINLWMIAAEDKKKSGNLPEIQTLAFRLRISATKVRNALNRLSNWIEPDNTIAKTGGTCYQGASKSIADCYQDASEGASAETEGEGEGELLAKKEAVVSEQWKMDDNFTSPTFGQIINSVTGEVRNA